MNKHAVLAVIGMLMVMGGVGNMDTNADVPGWITALLIVGGLVLAAAQCEAVLARDNAIICSRSVR